MNASIAARRLGRHCVAALRIVRAGQRVDPWYFRSDPLKPNSTQRHDGRLFRVNPPFASYPRTSAHRPQRPFACQPVSVGNVSVTGHSTVNHVERQLLDLTNAHFRPTAAGRSLRSSKAGIQVEQSLGAPTHGQQVGLSCRWGFCRPLPLWIYYRTSSMKPHRTAAFRFPSAASPDPCLQTERIECPVVGLM